MSEKQKVKRCYINITDYHVDIFSKLLNDKSSLPKGINSMLQIKETTSSYM